MRSPYSLQRKHGVKRIRQTAQDREAKRQREQSRIKDYLALTNVILTGV
jgi:geranylgeranyl transferase type-2 subunit alpha